MGSRGPYLLHLSHGGSEEVAGVGIEPVDVSVDGEAGEEYLSLYFAFELNILVCQSLYFEKE
jgi:hypothetical protein